MADNDRVRIWILVAKKNMKGVLPNSNYIDLSIIAERRVSVRSARMQVNKGQD